MPFKESLFLNWTALEKIISSAATLKREIASITIFVVKYKKREEILKYKMQEMNSQNLQPLNQYPDSQY